MAAEGPSWRTGEEILVTLHGFREGDNPEFQDFDLAVAVANYFIHHARDVKKDPTFKKKPYFEMPNKKNKYHIQFQEGVNLEEFKQRYSNPFQGTGLSFGKNTDHWNRAGMLQGFYIGDKPDLTWWHVDVDATNPGGKTNHINIELSEEGSKEKTKILIDLASDIPLDHSPSPRVKSFEDFSAKLENLYVQAKTSEYFLPKIETDIDNLNHQYLEMMLVYKKIKYLKLDSWLHRVSRVDAHDIQQALAKEYRESLKAEKENLYIENQDATTYTQKHKSIFRAFQNAKNEFQSRLEVLIEEINQSKIILDPFFDAFSKESENKIKLIAAQPDLKARRKLIVEFNEEYQHFLRIVETITQLQHLFEDSVQSFLDERLFPELQGIHLEEGKTFLKAILADTPVLSNENEYRGQPDFTLETMSLKEFKSRVDEVIEFSRPILTPIYEQAEKENIAPPAQARARPKVVIRESDAPSEIVDENLQPRTPLAPHTPNAK